MRMLWVRLAAMPEPIWLCVCGNFLFNRDFILFGYKTERSFHAWPPLLRACLALWLNLRLTKFQIFFSKIECDLYFLDRFDVLMSKMIFKK
jgi:hypothetical protein